MKEFPSKAISLIVGILCFTIMWFPVALITSSQHFGILFALFWGYVSYCLARVCYREILDKLLDQSVKEEVLTVEDIVAEADSDDVDGDLTDIK